MAAGTKATLVCGARAGRAAPANVCTCRAHCRLTHGSWQPPATRAEGSQQAELPALPRESTDCPRLGRGIPGLLEQRKENKARPKPRSQTVLTNAMALPHPKPRAKRTESHVSHRDHGDSSAGTSPHRRTSDPPKRRLGTGALPSLHMSTNQKAVVTCLEHWRRGRGPLKKCEGSARPRGHRKAAAG